MRCATSAIELTAPTTVCRPSFMALVRAKGLRAPSALKRAAVFASALLLSERIGGWKVSVTGANEDELPYVDMTRRR